MESGFSRVVKAMRSPEWVTTFAVLCPDGAQRHTGTFGTRDEAETFADQGHVCLKADSHSIFQVGRRV